MSTPFSLPAQPATVLGDIGPPVVIPFTPKPIGGIILVQAEYDQTIITRNWREGDPQRCNRCPECKANPCNTCTVVAPGILDAKSALDHRFTR